MTDRLRALWDVADLDETTRRLEAALAEEAREEGRAEVLTQLARVEGLRGRFDAGERLLAQARGAAGDSAAAAVRIDLERGRLRRSAGSPETALPLFAAASERADAAGLCFLPADAAHMAALVAEGSEGSVEWTQRGIDLAERHEEASYWAGPLLSSLGWHHYEAGA